MSKMLEDGGNAILNEGLHLPPNITFTRLSIGPIGQWDDSHVLISMDMFNRMFSFVLHKDRFMDVYNSDTVLITIKWTKVMKVQQSLITGEMFYPIAAVVV